MLENNAAERQEDSTWKLALKAIAGRPKLKAFQLSKVLYCTSNDSSAFPAST